MNTKLSCLTAVLLLTVAMPYVAWSNQTLVDGKNDKISLASSDSSIVQIFDWAVKTSMKYVGNDNDPVGPWYEASLPDREAFCIRDISHQCRGAEVIGLGRQNRNMFTKFVQNISEARDYCTYWEMNRYNKPAPIDYTSDQDFWYNLNANFDIIDACYKLYKWSGDSTYIYGEPFERFFSLTLNEYVKRWQLQADLIMNREGLMNVPDPQPAYVRYKTQRGIPSYIETVPGLVVTSDLVAMIYNGFRLCAGIEKMKKNEEKSRTYEETALKYKRLFETQWLNESSGSYYNYRVKGGKFLSGGTNMYPLWYHLIDSPDRIKKYLDAGSPSDRNLEHLSYLPMLYYRYGYNEQAYNFIQQIFANPRREYPEASSGVIEGIVMGMMGIEASAPDNAISTCSRLAVKTGWMSVENVNTFAGKISVKHESGTKTTLANKGTKEFIWRVIFKGNALKISIDGKRLPGKSYTDMLGNQFSYAEIKVKPNSQSVAAVNKE